MGLKQIHVMVEETVISQLSELFPDRGMRSFIVRRLITKFVAGCVDGRYESTDKLIESVIKSVPIADCMEDCDDHC